MKNQTKSFLIALCLIALGVVLRVVHIIPNFSPITAIALFGGAYIADKRWALIIPVVAMLIGDLLIAKMGNYPFFHDTFAFIYAAFLLITLGGFYLRKNKAPLQIAGMAIGASLLFFIISNFGVWVAGNMYPHTMEGFLQCYIMAIPFYGWTLVSDLIYSAVLFTVYPLIIKSLDKNFQPAA